MSKWFAGLIVIAAQVVTACADQGQFSDSGFGGGFQPSSPPPPPPMQAYAPPPLLVQPYIYLTRGQTPQQEESDKGQCYGWAVQQTGFDPANPRVATPPPPPMYSGQPQAPQGGLFRGAAGGARLWGLSEAP